MSNISKLFVLVLSFSLSLLSTLSFTGEYLTNLKCTSWWVLTHVYTCETITTAKIMKLFITSRSFSWSFVTPLTHFSPSAYTSFLRKHWSASCHYILLHFFELLIKSYNMYPLYWLSLSKISLRFIHVLVCIDDLFLLLK